MFSLKLGLGVAIVYWLLATGRFRPGMYTELASAASLSLVAGALLAQTLSLGIVMGRWWLLLHARGIDISLREAVWISCRGSFMGLFLPGTLGMDGLRIYHLRQHCRTQLAAGIASVTLDRALGFAGLLILATGFSAAYVLFAGPGMDGAIVAWMLGLLACCIAGLLLACGYGPAMLYARLQRVPLMGAFVASLAAYREDHGALLWVTLLSALAHFLITLAAAMGLSALGLDYSFLALAAVTPMLIVVRFLPITPLGLGVTDAVAVELYQAVGLTGGAENQMLLRATWILLILSCGLSFLWRPRHGATPATGEAGA